MALPWQAFRFVKERWAKIFRFLKEMAFSLHKSKLYRIFLVQIQSQHPKVDPSPKFYQIEQKIKDLEFRPQMIPKTARRRHRNFISF